jgi:nucleotide-binding universal stress UspA family protein
MSWNPIIAGVDASPEGAWAGAAAWRFAKQAGAECRLVHAVTEHWLPDPDLPLAMHDVAMLRRHAETQARRAIEETLAGNMPPEAIERLEIRFGHPARALQEAAQDLDADLIVVGAKRHRRLSRWLAGSTAHDVVRLVQAPVLVATSSVAQIERVLVAVDLSDSGPATIAAGERLAALTGAALRFVHLIPQLPIVPEAPLDLDIAEYYRTVEKVVDESVWPLIKTASADRVIRRDAVRHGIISEAESWRADVLVVGSHGQGLVDRILLGSMTEGLLRSLPTSVLVVPTHLAARLTAGRRTLGAAAVGAP